MEEPPSFIDEKTRLNLQQMMKDNDVDETTDRIRTLKHSKLIRQDVNSMRKLKKQYTRLSVDQFKSMATKRCNFLFNNYTNIFNRLLTDELDYNIIHKFLDVLEDIETGKLDQHEGSFKIGTVLKELYVDSALRRENRLGDNGKKVSYKKPAHKISWNQFKAINENGTTN